MEFQFTAVKPKGDEPDDKVYELVVGQLAAIVEHCKSMPYDRLESKIKLKFKTASGAWTQDECSLFADHLAKVYKGEGMAFLKAMRFPAMLAKGSLGGYVEIPGSEKEVFDGFLSFLRQSGGIVVEETPDSLAGL